LFLNVSFSSHHGLSLNAPQQLITPIFLLYKTTKKNEDIHYIEKGKRWQLEKAISGGSNRR
jgi:hypothetical protein